MRKLICVVFLMAGISIASIGVSSAQDVKTKAACCKKDAACCNKEKVTAGTMKSGECPMKAKTVALTSGDKAKGTCTVKTALCPGKPVQAIRLNAQ